MNEKQLLEATQAQFQTWETQEGFLQRGKYQNAEFQTLDLKETPGRYYASIYCDTVKNSKLRTPQVDLT